MEARLRRLRLLLLYRVCLCLRSEVSAGLLWILLLPTRRSAPELGRTDLGTGVCFVAKLELLLILILFEVLDCYPLIL